MQDSNLQIEFFFSIRVKHIWVTFRSFSGRGKPKKRFSGHQKPKNCKTENTDVVIVETQKKDRERNWNRTTESSTPPIDKETINQNL